MEIMRENLQNNKKFEMSELPVSKGRNLLKGKIAELGYRQEDICRLIERSANYVGRRVNHHASFSVNEMRKIGNLLEIPESELLRYFS